MIQNQVSISIQAVHLLPRNDFKTCFFALQEQEARWCVKCKGATVRMQSWDYGWKHYIRWLARPDYAVGWLAVHR
jgi:hypothetical protein